MTNPETITAFGERSVIAGRFPVHRITMKEPKGIWRDIVIHRLQELVTLDKGWDGYEGLPVSFENAYFALQMLDHICTPTTSSPQIVPGAAGDLQIEWHTLNGDVELHVRGPNNVHAWRCKPGHSSIGQEENLTTDFRSVANWINEVSGDPIVFTSAAA